MTTLAEAPTLSPTCAVSLQHAASGLWRVTNRRGWIHGHLRAVDSPQGTTYHAQRYSARYGAFHDVGRFSSAQAAVSALLAS